MTVPTPPNTGEAPTCRYCGTVHDSEQACLVQHPATDGLTAQELSSIMLGWGVTRIDSHMQLRWMAAEILTLRAEVGPVTAVPTPPNTDTLIEEIVAAGPPAHFINLRTADDTLAANDGTILDFGPQLLVDWEEAVAFVLAHPSVASALTLRQMVIDEQDWARVGGWGAEGWNAGVDAHNEAFARLRAVVEENPP